MFDFSVLKSILLSLKLILREVKIYYFISESFLEELSNVNHFTLKSIPTKSILTELILPKLNWTNVEPNTHLFE